MQGALLIALPVALIAVLLALGYGIFSFARDGANGQSTGRRQNKLMQWRIGLQFAAVIVIMALFFLISQGN